MRTATKPLQIAEGISIVIDDGGAALSGPTAGKPLGPTLSLKRHGRFIVSRLRLIQDGAVVLPGEREDASPVSLRRLIRRGAFTVTATANDGEAISARLMYDGKNFSVASR